MMLKSAFRVNDFISINGTSMSNGVGSGTIIAVDETTITTRAQFTGETYVLAMADLTQKRASFSNSDFTRFIMADYYWR